mmetsp:Transcript_45672/g.141175  ORF Transcript_45672/g.141175 Transcript_45672/m.141175 type:complete len:143 (-) Transcript_45672:1929-2357(-)
MRPAATAQDKAGTDLGARARLPSARQSARCCQGSAAAAAAAVLDLGGDGPSGFPSRGWGPGPGPETPRPAQKMLPRLRSELDLHQTATDDAAPWPGLLPPRLRQGRLPQSPSGPTRKASEMKKPSEYRKEYAMVAKMSRAIL